MRNDPNAQRPPRPLDIIYAMTPQEHAFFASDVDVPTRESWFIPVGLNEGKSHEQILEARSSGWARNPTLESGYRAEGYIGKEENFAIELAQLDPVTFQTLEDPRSFAGIWDPETKRLDPRREMTEVSKRTAVEAGMQVVYRDGRENAEGQRRGHPERG